MATSGHDLVREIARLTDVPHPDAVLADQAITALGHTSRALIRLADRYDDSPQPVIVRRQLVLRELGTVGRIASSRWSPAPGRLPDLAGAVADIAGMRGPGLDEDSWWAVGVTLSAVTRRCVEAATRFAPYARAPELLRVGRVAGMVERLAAVDPPRGRGGALDALIPVADLAPGLSTGRRVVESVAGLVAALEREIRSNSVHLYEVLAAAAAAETVARHATAFAAASPAPYGQPAWAQAPAAWRVAQAALIRFDDGSRYASVPPSAVTRWAMHLTNATERLPEAGRLASPADLVGLIAATRFAAGQLAPIAAHIETAMYRRVGDGKLFARARALPQSARHVRAVVRDEVVIATPHDLRDAVAAARTAGRLSAALATQIPRSATVRHQPRLGLEPGLQVERRSHLLPGNADSPGLSVSREDMVQRSSPQIAH